MTLANKVQEFNEQIVPTARQIVHGDANTVVQTDGGPVRSIAKLIADNDVAVNASGILGKVNNAAAAAAGFKDQAQAATAVAQAARDAAKLTAGVYPDAATGLAAVAEGAYFSLASADAAQYLMLYRKVGGVASLIASYPSQGAVQTILDRFGSGTAVFPFTLEDEVGRVLLGIDPSGKFSFNELNFGGALFKQGGLLQLLSLAAQSLTSASTQAEHGFMPFNVQDDLGRIVAGIGSDGDFHSRRYRIGASAALQVGTRRDLPFFLEDALGRVPLAVTSAGQLNYIGSDQARPVVPVVAKPAAVKAAINHIITYGQSLSIGGASVPPISTVQPYNALMFNGGVRTTYPQTVKNTFVPLVEQYDNASSGETPSSGTAQAINQLLTSDGISLTNFQLFLSAPGYGGKTAYELSKGREYFTSLIEDITVGAQLANAQGKSFALQAVTYTQGENDEGSRTPRATWKSQVKKMFSDIASDCKAITGQKHEPIFIIYQMASYYQASAAPYPELALGQLELAEEGGGIYMATPMYIFDYIANDLHLMPQSSKLLGAYYGLVYHTVVLEGGDWKPLMPVDFDVRGKTISVKFNAEKLAFDTARVTAVANKGFSVVDAAGSPLTITDVYIVGNDTVDVVLSTIPAAGTRLRYAIENQSGSPGRTQGVRGNVREDKPGTPVFEPAGLNFPLHRWLVMFDKTVN